MKRHCLVVFLTTCLIVAAFSSCHREHVVNISFYYWKTVYEDNKVEKQYFDTLHCKKLYLRIMDVDKGDTGPMPVSPVSFKSSLPSAAEVIPVVFIVNNVLKNQTQSQLNGLASKIVYYVNGKMRQSGKTTFTELQIDCDWTRTTRENYFYLLNCIKANTQLKNKQISATLRLHQLKNQKSSGIPPVNRVMLMCYNMGNLRKYGIQNSILAQNELEKYIGNNLSDYPMPIDVGLPLFSWAVVFRQKQYIGIAKGLNSDSLNKKNIFKATAQGQIYQLMQDLPAHGLKRGDEVRWEAIPALKLQAAALYIRKYVSSDTVNVIYFHLNEPTLKHYNYETLEKTAALFH
jgi:hypothetical protein